MTRQQVLAFGLFALTLFATSARFASAEDHKAQAEHAPAAAAGAEHAPAAHDAPAAHGGGEHAAAAQPNILEPQVPLAIWTVVVFVVLLTILGKFAWKPLLKALHDREEHMEHCLHEAERARNEAERLLAENQKNLAKTAETVRALLEEAKRNAEVTANTIVQKAQADAEASRDRAEREIGVARDQALSDIYSKTADLAVAVAGKVLAKSLTDADQRRLADTAMAELPSMANGQGGR